MLKEEIKPLVSVSSTKVQEFSRGGEVVTSAYSKLGKLSAEEQIKSFAIVGKPKNLFGEYANRTVSQFASYGVRTNMLPSFREGGLKFKDYSKQSNIGVQQVKRDVKKFKVELTPEEQAYLDQQAELGYESDTTFRGFRIPNIQDVKNYVPVQGSLKQQLNIYGGKQKISPLSFSKTFLDNSGITKTSESTKSVLDSKTLEQLKSINGLKGISTTKTFDDSKIVSSLKSISMLDYASLSKTALDSSTRTKAKTDLNTVLKTVTPFKYKYNIKEIPKIPVPPKWNKPRYPRSVEKPIRKKGIGYLTFIRRKGKIVKISDEPLSYGLALEQGKTATRRGLSQSFFIKTFGYTKYSDTMAPSLSEYRLKKPTSKIREQVFIEKNPLATKRETRLLSQAKKSKRSLFG